MAIPFPLGVYGRNAAAIGVIALAGCSGKSEPTPVAKASPGALQSSPSESVIPTTGYGITHRNVRVGFTVNPDWDVAFEVGVAGGPFGASVTVVKFSHKDQSIRIVLDPEVSAEIGPLVAKWSTEGFGQELTVKSSRIKGRAVFDAKADITRKSTHTSAVEGYLNLSGRQKAFIPIGSEVPAQGLGLMGGYPLALYDSTPGLHLEKSLVKGKFVPEPGYAWMDGAQEARDAFSGNLLVIWKSGLQSPLAKNLWSSEQVGYWQPGAGYVWESGTREGRLSALAFGSVIQWVPGLPWPGHPHVVTSSEEGKVRPAPGYTWAQNAPVNLAVRALVEPMDK